MMEGFFMNEVVELSRKFIDILLPKLD